MNWHTLAVPDGLRINRLANRVLKTTIHNGKGLELDSDCVSHGPHHLKMIFKKKKEKVNFKPGSYIRRAEIPLFLPDWHKSKYHSPSVDQQSFVSHMIFSRAGSIFQEIYTYGKRNQNLSALYNIQFFFKWCVKNQFTQQSSCSCFLFSSWRCIGNILKLSFDCQEFSFLNGESVGNAQECLWRENILSTHLLGRTNFPAFWTKTDKQKHMTSWNNIQWNMILMWTMKIHLNRHPIFIMRIHTAGQQESVTLCLQFTSITKSENRLRFSKDFQTRDEWNAMSVWNVKYRTKSVVSSKFLNF